MPAAPPFTGVVVAEILSAEPHPQADKLRVCRVTHRLRCAADDRVRRAQCPRGTARARSRVVGAQLPGDLHIRAAKLRGVESQGMLCSAKELGLAEASSGILELAADAPLGTALRDYLELDEVVLDLNVTPNRGDAMSVLGIAREVAALAGTKVTGPRISALPRALTETFPVTLDAPAACPRFAALIVRGIDNRGTSAPWLRERLRRAGVRAISPVVDVTNYVMLELGQPMHAYDLARLEGEIRVRHARSGDTFTLLDGREITPDPDMLLITDAKGPVGLAGIMGGERTAVSAETRDVLFESAFFAPEAIVGRARRVGLLTDAVQRFERGVDPSGQERAIERAVMLLGQGSAQSLQVAQSAAHIPKRAAVSLRASQLKRLLGADIPGERVRESLEHLGMQVQTQPQGWRATPPPARFDIAIEADLIEEVARIVGFEAIPERDAGVPQAFRNLPGEHADSFALLEILAARGYQEAISFAFVDPLVQRALFPDEAELALANPIASDLSVMRVSLWPGLLKAAQENQHRQQERVRLMEHGTRFRSAAGGTLEIDSIAGIASAHGSPSSGACRRRGGRRWISMT